MITARVALTLLAALLGLSSPASMTPAPRASTTPAPRASVLPPPSPIAAQTSPTGRNPKLLWTAERQAVWQRMKTDAETPSLASTPGAQWYRILKNNAECACRYGDNGIYGTLMYQFTGDRRYAQIAWTRIANGFLKRSPSTLVGNYAREYSAEMVVFYDWLTPALSAEQRQQFLAKLNEMFTALVTGNRYTNPAMPIRTADTDQAVGSYFGLAFLYLATADHNPTAADLYSRPFVGGLDASARDRTTLRNAIEQYVTELAAGGEWMESSDYNLGTVRLLVLGAEGVRTATGVDHFAEVTRFSRQFALRQIYMLTNDLRYAVQWGDEQSPRQIQAELYAWQTTNGVLAGITQGDAESGPFIQKLVASLSAKYGMSGNKSAEPWGRFFFLFNPYAAAEDYKTLPLAWYASGQGLVVARDGWSDGSTIVALHMPQQQPSVDHQVSYFGDFQMYRKGEWAITHPISYSGPALKGEGTNAMVIGSFSSMAEFKRVKAQEQAADNSYTYISGTTGGQKSPEGSYDPPPTFLSEWTRSLVYLPSRDAHSDTIVVFDRTNAQNPRELTKFTRYRTRGPDEQTAILEMPGLKQWIIHSPVEPTLTPGGLSWSTPGGQSVAVDTLLPTAQRRLVYNETELWSETAVRATERKWQTRIVPAVEQAWDTFLNVVQVFDSGTGRSNVLGTQHQRRRRRRNRAPRRAQRHVADLQRCSWLYDLEWKDRTELDI